MKTQNTEWGFWGTMRDNYGVVNPDDTIKVWNAAVMEIKAITGESEEQVGAFLDSPMGRHFADTISFQLPPRKPTVKEMIKAIKLEAKSVRYKKLMDYVRQARR